MWAVAVLTRWPHQRGFLMRKRIVVLPGKNHIGRNKEVTVSWGSTVLANLHELFTNS